MDLINIGAFAAASGLTIPALRHYDEIGLLRPAEVDPVTGYRRYAEEQLDVARLICGLRAVGVPIDEVRTIVAGPAADILPALGAHRERLVAQARELSQRISAVDEFTANGASLPQLQAVHPVQLRIGVRDVGAAAAFYTAAFDLVFLEAISSVQFGVYRTERFFLLTLEAEAAPHSTRFGLLVADVDTAHSRALAAGAGEVHGPEDFAWKPRTSCVRDLDGHLIDLSQA